MRLRCRHEEDSAQLQRPQEWVQRKEGHFLERPRRHCFAENCHVPRATGRFEEPMYDLGCDVRSYETLETLYNTQDTLDWAS